MKNTTFCISVLSVVLLGECLVLAAPVDRSKNLADK